MSGEDLLHELVGESMAEHSSSGPPDKAVLFPHSHPFMARNLADKGKQFLELYGPKSGLNFQPDTYMARAACYLFPVQIDCRFLLKPGGRLVACKTSILLMVPQMMYVQKLRETFMDRNVWNSKMYETQMPIPKYVSTGVSALQIGTLRHMKQFWYIGNIQIERKRKKSREFLLT
jgi:hypothetical protein